MKVEGDTVYVKLSDMSTSVASDRYYTEEYKELIDHVLQEPILHKPPSRYPIHSSRKDLK